MQSHWSRYLCVLVAGFLETSVRSIYSDFARKSASGKVANYVEAKLRPTLNLKMSGILQLTRAFSPEWAEQLSKNTEGERKAAVDSIVANRNQIAHGQPVEITYGRIKRYYDKVVEVLELIENHCDGV